MEKYTNLKNNRVSLKDAIPLETPFTLFVDPTNRCNFKCSFCPRNQDDFHDYAGDYTDMDKNVFDKIVSDLKEFPDRLKVIRLFYLGEPLLSKNFTYFLNKVINNHLAERVEISTNASLLTKEMSKEILSAAALGEWGVSVYLRVSVYSVIQEKNEHITSNPISVETIFNNVDNFKKMRDEMHLSNVRIYAKKLTTFDDEDACFKEIYYPAVDEVELEEPMEWSSEGNRELLDDVYSSEEIASIKNKTMPKVCAFPFHTMAIQSDGDVVCCCTDWTRGTFIGNVKKESLLDIWNGEKIRKLQYLHLSGRRSEIPCCKNCLRLPCGGAYEADNLDNVDPDEFVKKCGDIRHEKKSS